MNVEPTASTKGWSHSRLARLFTFAGGRMAGMFAVAVLLAVGIVTSRDYIGWSESVFDLFQRLHPRSTEQYPVIIVEIDERSLQKFGQWPWPRGRIATLLDRIAADGALAIGFDILFTEPDQASPRAFVDSYPALDPALAKHIVELPDTDVILGNAIRNAPVVMARAMADGVEAQPWQHDTITTAPLNLEGTNIAGLPHGDALIHGLAGLEQQASGFGVLTPTIDADGTVRRMPLAWSVQGAPVPALALEMLRVALGSNWSTLHSGTSGVEAVGIGDASFATYRDGSVRPWFAPSVEKRYLSAAAVLDSEVQPTYFTNHLVLIGVTGLGTQDRVRTPLGRMNGTEVHAQTIENLLAGTMLTRPTWARTVELAAGALFGLLLVVLMPRFSPTTSAAITVTGVAVLLIAGYIAFLHSRLLFDPTFPATLGLVAFVVMLGALLTENDRLRRALAVSLELERLNAARMAGELRAAGAIQMALLPDTRKLAVPRGLRVHALLEPAKDVGGDLYDMLMIDRRRLFFVVGDVTGKGLPASLFMAISKALCKSAMLRTVQTPDLAMMTANAEISRENPGALFVTTFMGVIDADTGCVEFCNAGHENPLILGCDGVCRELKNDGGPPLCVMDDFPYPLERTTLAPGETLVIVTDGVTEARSPTGALFGRDELLEGLHTLAGFAADPERLAQGVRTLARTHEAGADPTDDLTVAVIHYAGNR